MRICIDKKVLWFIWNNFKVIDEILQNLLQFNRSSILKKGIHMFLANFFDLKIEKKVIKKYFNVMDNDKNGELSFDELVEAYQYKVFFKKNNKSTNQMRLSTKLKKFMILQIGKEVNLSHFWSSSLQT